MRFFSCDQLPDGQITKSLSIPPRRNIPLNLSGKSAALLRASHPREGRVAIVTNVAGRWGGRGMRTRRKRVTRTAKACGPDAPGLAFKSAGRIPPATGGKETFTGGSAK